MSAVRVRVATFNIRNGRAFDGRNSWPFRRSATVSSLDRLDADVVALQEVYRFQLRYLAPRLAHLDGASTGRSRGDRGEHCPVLWRRQRFHPLRTRTLWYGGHHDAPGSRLAGARFPRIATIVLLADRSTGDRFVVANTHLDERRAALRRLSLDQLVTWLDPALPTIIAGDLNAAPGDPELDPLLDAGFVDALPTPGPGSVHGFSGRTDGRRIDHLLVSAHWCISDSRVVTSPPTRRLPSDHWPVVADLELAIHV